MNRIVTVLILSLFSTAAFAGRDGAQVMQQEAANKKVAAERRLAAKQSESDKACAAQTTINGATAAPKPIASVATDTNR